MYSIKTENLDIAYSDTTIVQNLNLEIAEGKITTIIGPNGCGKSTVLKTIGRIIKPKNGFVYLNGADIKRLKTGEIAQKMAILPQSPKAPEGITVRELVSYGRFPYQTGFGRLRKEEWKIVDWALQETKLCDLKEAKVDLLSGGQRQRVWIAMALAQQTSLILLDEPTTYLDLAYQLEILELLYRLNRKQSCTIVMVLHDLNLAARFSDYMIALNDGKIVAHGMAEEVMTTEVLLETFHIHANILKDPNSGRPAYISYNLVK